MLRERSKLNKFTSEQILVPWAICPVADGMLMAWRHETQAALDLPGQPLEFGGDEDPTNSTGERKKLGPFFSATVVLTSLHLPPRTQNPLTLTHWENKVLTSIRMNHTSVLSKGRFWKQKKSKKKPFKNGWKQEKKKKNFFHICGVLGFNNIIGWQVN